MSDKDGDEEADRPAAPQRYSCLLSVSAERDLVADPDPTLTDEIRKMFAGGKDPPRLRRRRVPGRRGQYVARIAGRSVVYHWLTEDQKRRAIERLRLGPGGSAEADRVADGRIAYVSAVGDDIPLPLTLLLPLVLAVVAFGLGLLLAPERMGDNTRHEQFAGLFGTIAQVIATLFVALAIEARSQMVNVQLASVTVGYIALGLTTALVAGSPSLPECLYGWLLAFALMGGAGALASTTVIAYWSLSRPE